MTPQDDSTMKHLCPCGSHISLNECCRPILNNHRTAKTPERLMRSRFTAFSLRDEAHLLSTWADSTRPIALHLPPHSEQLWIKLIIISSDLALGGDTGSVHFQATSISSKRVLTLEERSRFIRERESWVYLDGVCNTQEKTLGANAPCPCGSNKKFKRCCKMRQETLR